jgi:hypothetical protein
MLFFFREVVRTRRAFRAGGRPRQMPYPDQLILNQILTWYESQNEPLAKHQGIGFWSYSASSYIKDLQARLRRLQSREGWGLEKGFTFFQPDDLDTGPRRRRFRT